MKFHAIFAFVFVALIVLNVGAERVRFGPGGDIDILEERSRVADRIAAKVASKLKAMKRKLVEIINIETAMLQTSFLFLMSVLLHSAFSFIKFT